MQKIGFLHALLCHTTENELKRFSKKDTILWARWKLRTFPDDCMTKKAFQKEDNLVAVITKS